MCFPCQVSKMQSALDLCDTPRLGPVTLPPLDSQRWPLPPPYRTEQGQSIFLSVPSATYHRAIRIIRRFLMTEVTSRGLGRGSHCGETLVSSARSQRAQGQGKRCVLTGAALGCGEEARWVAGSNNPKCTIAHYSNKAILNVKSASYFQSCVPSTAVI